MASAPPTPQGPVDPPSMRAEEWLEAEDSTAASEEPVDPSSMRAEERVEDVYARAEEWVEALRAEEWVKAARAEELLEAADFTAESEVPVAAAASEEQVDPSSMSPEEWLDPSANIVSNVTPTPPPGKPTGTPGSALATSGTANSTGGAMMSPSTTAPSAKNGKVQELPKKARDALCIGGVLLMILVGCALGAKASIVPAFWVVNVASDALFAVAVAASLVASKWVFDAAITRRINQGKETPVRLLTGGLEGMRLETRSVPSHLRCLAWLAFVVGFSQLLADTGLDAELMPVARGNGLVFVADTDCNAQRGYELMRDGPAGATGAYARNVGRRGTDASIVIRDEDMPLALLARDIYSGRVPDNGGMIERVGTNPKVFSGAKTAYFSDNKGPIMSMPLSIPVQLTDVKIKAEYGDTLTNYIGPAYVPVLDAVVKNSLTANKLWAVILHEDVEGAFLDKLNDVFNFDFPDEPEEFDGYSYQFRPVGIQSDFRVLLALQEPVEDFFGYDSARIQLDDVPIPSDAIATHLYTVRGIRTDQNSGYDYSATGAWTIITERAIPPSSFWPIWEGAVPASGTSLGRGGTIIEDLARVVHASLLTCGEVTTGEVGTREVRAVVRGQWFAAYVGLWVYVLVCIVLAAYMMRNEPYVPIPRSWYDGYQVAVCDGGSTASLIVPRNCDQRFGDPTESKVELMYNISDGQGRNHDILGLTSGNVVARTSRPLHP